VSTTKGLFLFYTVANKKEASMIFKDKEVLALLKTIDRKLDIIITMKKTDKIKEASKKTTNKGGK
jgi:hypothetical protein